MYLLLAFLPLAMALPGPMFIEEVPQEMFNPRIIGGSEVDPVGKYPWQGSLRIDGIQTCGCVYIGQEWLLTAAHCVEDQNVASLTVVLGVHSLYSSTPGQPETHQVAEYTMHEDYNQGPGLLPDDIAVIRLETIPNANNEYVGTISMAEGTYDYAGDQCDISGWGYDGTIYPDLLQEVRTEVISHELCDEMAGDILDGQVCVYTGVNGACWGDSGGPLVCPGDGSGQTTLVGLTSWLRGFCDIALPGGYTRVSHYRDWIRDKTGI